MWKKADSISNLINFNPKIHLQCLMGLHHLVQSYALLLDLMGASKWLIIVHTVVKQTLLTKKPILAYSLTGHGFPSASCHDT